METHAPHVHHSSEKKFSQYFYEFLMLFLAVFFGFMAEYFLEHQIEKEKEGQFIKSLVSDLKDDIKSLDRNIDFQKTGLLLMDSLLSVLTDPVLVFEKRDMIYYAARVGPRIGSLSTNTKTFDQLKNSGGFRLIRNGETADKIMTYYNQFPMIRLLENIFMDEFSQYKIIGSKIFDPMVLRKMEMENGTISRSANNPELRTYDKELLKELGFFILQINGSRRAILETEYDIKQSANGLITYLEKNYDME